MTASLEKWLSLEAFILLRLPLPPRTDNPLCSHRTLYSTHQGMETQTGVHKMAGCTRITASCWMTHV